MFKYFKMQKLKIISRFILCTLLCSFYSCKNDFNKVNILTVKNESPYESGKNVEILYTVDGKPNMKMKSPILNKYAENDKPSHIELPKGVEIYFYNEQEQVKSFLTANYAIDYENKRIMEARNNVVVKNEKGEVLNTEHLTWDQNKKLIFSDKFVKITTKDEILYGEGMESDEAFAKWVIKKPTGILNIKK